MLGSIIGDIIGSCYEFNNTNEIDFDLFSEESTFTDDTVLTVATADAILSGEGYLEKYQDSYFRYPNRGWGGMFDIMARDGNLGPYNSFGNGSAMRVSPCGWAYNSYDRTLEEAEATAIVTHNHPEGIKGAKAVAGAIYIARNGGSKDEIMKAVSSLGYDLRWPLSSFKSVFDETCQGTIPICMALFNETDSFEDAIRMTIAHGGDCDTTGCIVGGIAEAFYGRPPQFMIIESFKRIPDKMKRTVLKFVRKFCYNDFEDPLSLFKLEDI
ncbi:MAG: ADP-ribosylglycohydrolase family protein [Synergistaceae bacterium]